MLGCALGPYHLEAELGSGGMGSVYRARVERETAHLSIGRQVAVKVIHPYLIKTPNALQRFLLEGKLGRRVRHPNVVSTFDCAAAQVDGREHHFLVMEYVQGQTLRELLDELGTLPEELCRSFGRQIAGGLGAIHAAGAVHRDLKPENVLVTRDHRVKVMDLGVARLLRDPLRLSSTGQFVGSVLYAPPEAFRRGGGDVDGRADLHSLGVLLYEIATGRHPYRHDDVQRVLRLILTSEPQRAGEVNAQISPFLEEVIHTLCAKRAADRFRSADQVRRILEVGEESTWWRERARAITATSHRPLRRVRVARDTALYGREAELARMRAAYAKACSGAGQVLLIDGEAGIGKTRLVDEFITQLQAEGEAPNFLFGSYPSGGAATVAGAFNTAFREHFGSVGLEETLGSYLPVTPLMVPAFASFLRGESPPPGQEPLTKDSVQSVFIYATQSLAEERPTVILIDDLHFAPAEGRALFAALALAIAEHQVLLLGTMRPEVPLDWAAEVQRPEHAERMRIGRLRRSELERLLDDVFGSAALAERLAPSIAEESDGNPFFVFEILRSLRDRGQIMRAPDGKWTAASAAPDIHAPSSILEMVRVRLDRLDEADRQLLEAAACCGFRFDPLLLPSVLDLEEIDVLRRLGRIERLHQLVRSVGRGCNFDHHLVHDVLYRGLSDLLKEHYHARIADVLAERARVRGTPLETLESVTAVEICTHALKGGRQQRALATLKPALAHLEAGYLQEAALALAEEALAVPGLLDGAERCRTLLGTVERLHMLGRRDAQREALAAAERLATGTPLEPRMHRFWAELHSACGETDDAMRRFELAYETAHELGMASDEAAALCRLGTQNARLGKAEEAHDQFRASIELARDIGDRQAETVTTGNLALAYYDGGNYERALELMQRHLALAKETGNRRSEGIATGNLGVLLMELGRPEEAGAHIRAKLEIARQIGDRMGAAVATANLGMVLHDLGHFEEARRAYEACVEIAREIGAREGEGNAAGNLGMVFQSLGRYALAADRYRHAVRIARDIGDPITEADALSNLGTLEVGLGCFEAAEKTLERSLELARGVGAARVEGYALHGLALLAEERGEMEVAEGLHAQVEPIWTAMGAKEALAETHVAAGRLALQRGASEHAAEHFDAALELCRDTHAPGTTLVAEVLRASLPGGDARRALDTCDALEGRVGVADWMAAHLGLYEITGARAHLDEARRALATLLANAPASCQEATRTRVRLHRRISEAARPESPRST
ncbi:MAG: tetratricopeptide repeat protein [Planctomycetota bacterium]|nr:tetratricopeptide repeat protein [Planctomycetota bacterium]